MLAPGDRPALTASRLLQFTDSIVTQINAWRFGRGDRIGTALPAGAEAAVAMYGISAGFTYAPLNPRVARAELEDAIELLKIRAMVVVAGVDSPGRAAAVARGIPLIELSPRTTGPAGLFDLACSQPLDRAATLGGLAEPDDVFYVLQTSGTTAKPKVVPMSHRALLAAVSHNVASLALTPADRCLHVLSTSHVMGITTMLYSLMAGSQVACASFNAAEFPALVEATRPTWFTAPPAIHQSILRYADALSDVVAKSPVRFVRAGAAMLPIPVLQEIERVWRAPVVEAYAMSECPMITSNIAPPANATGDWRRQCKAGSVGRACGVAMILLDESGRPLPDGGDAVGEIAIRGPGLMAGYEDNPDANAASFADGWFRTGDLGRFDADGFLFLTGRRKEMINRGGVKIAPREIDDVVLQHPAILDALAFSLPDDMLGEEVGVAAVLKPGQTATELDIRQFVADRLSSHKVPKKVVFVEQIPAGRTGKAQRIGLAKILGLDQAKPTVAAGYAAPRNATEQALAAIWGQVLGKREPIGVHESFMDLGGDSLQAVAMFSEIAQLLGRELPVSALLAAPTVAQLAELMSREGQAIADVVAVPIQPAGTRTPLFCLPGMYGNVFTFYPLARQLGVDQPVYGLQLPRAEGSAVPERDVRRVATMLVEHLRKVQPKGPYQLAGYSYGGYVAFEMAQQLAAVGEEVSSLILFDTRGPGYPNKGSLPVRLLRKARAIAASRSIRPAAEPATSGSADPGFVELDGPKHIRDASIAALHAYDARRFDGRVVLIRAKKFPRWMEKIDPDPTLGWGKLTRSIEVVTLPGDHVTLLTMPNVAAVANTMRNEPGRTV